MMPTATPTERFELIPTTQIVESPTNPRRTFDPAALSELAESMLQYGILQPILTRTVGDLQEIICGARRFRAAVHAELQLIPCRIVEMSDDDVLSVQIIENAQREDVHPLEEAEGYKMLLDRGIYDVEQIAIKVGKSPETVARRLTLARLDPEVAAVLREQNAPVKGMEMVSALDLDGQREAVENLSYRPSVGQLKQRIQYLSRRLDGAKWPKDQLNIFPSAPACTRCAFNTASHGSLFEDLGRENGQAVCTNKSCYERKLDAYVQSKVNRAVVDHEALSTLRDKVA